MQHPKNTVAVIGAGPGGLVTARWLVQHGFEPILFDAADSLGGQWNAGGPASATWPGMRTNTSRVMTAFSDLDHASNVATYPTREDMLTYLEAYAANFDLGRRIRLRSQVSLLEAAPGGLWLLRSGEDERSVEELFHRVVIATGAQAKICLPEIAGMDGFTGPLGMRHTASYDGPERYRGRSVLVCGCSISALEIASELAWNGVKVSLAQRRQRYILPKLIAGVPAEHVMFNRAAALAGETLPMDALAHGLKAAVLKAGGSPDQFGAPKPDENIFAAGVSQSQGFLPAVAEGRISVRPWIERIDGESATFVEGGSERFDGILLGTGFGPSLSWMAPEVARNVNFDGKGIDLYAQTFHPGLEGLAFVGLYNLVGPYLPALELQARWIAYTWAGLIAPVSRTKMESGLEASRAMRARGQQPVMHELALTLARHAGVEPTFEMFPHLERALLFGPLSPASFRLQGSDKLESASSRTLAAAAAFGAIRDATFTLEEEGLRQLIAPSQNVAA